MTTRRAPKCMAACLASALAASATAGEPAHAFPWPDDLSGRTVLYMGAHPDDETYAAPQLAEACLERGAKCHFVVAADANSYGCLMTTGLRDPAECSRRRRQEMLASAARFGGTVEFYGWPESFYAHDEAGVGRVIARWGAKRGGDEALVARLLETLERTRPAMVLTFDPRHGSTCHPEHRAISRLLLRAVARLPEEARPALWFEQADNIRQRSPEVARINAQWGVALWPDLPEQVFWYDATHALPSGGSGYDWLLATLSIHATQYPDAATAEALSDPPASLRRIPWTRQPAEPHGDFCTALALDYPTMEYAENWKLLGVEPDADAIEAMVADEAGASP